MEIFTDLVKKENLSICLGFFDGVHEGHKVVIKNTVNLARQNGLRSAVVTFREHPLCYLQNRTPQYILSSKDRISLIEQQGADYVYMLEFDERIADLLAYDYLKDILIDTFHPEFITTGFNHYFGANRQGNADLLKNYQKEFGYKFFEIPPITFNNTLISSTKIRQLISDGQLFDIKKLLGQDFYIKAKIKDGDHIGRTLSFPTANMEYPEDIIKIARGVYAAIVEVDSKKYGAVVNYGMRPTVSDRKKMIVEAFLLDFSGNLYNKEAKVIFKQKIRNEKKFDSTYELKIQSAKDADFAREILSQKDSRCANDKNSTL